MSVNSVEEQDVVFPLWGKKEKKKSAVVLQSCFNSHLVEIHVLASSYIKKVQKTLVLLKA